MGQWEKASSCLLKKLQILEKIAVNTEAQCRFIHRREMKGLKRTLGEREVLIQKLNSINIELSSDKTWKSVQELTLINQEIQYKQRQIMERSSQSIQQATAERTCIAAELKNSKARRQVRRQYTNPWAAVVPGRRFNEKG